MKRFQTKTNKIALGGGLVLFLTLLSLILGTVSAQDLRGQIDELSHKPLHSSLQQACDQYLTQAKSYYTLSDGFLEQTASRLGSFYKLRGDIYVLLQRDCINNADITLLNKRVKTLEAEVARLKGAPASSTIVTNPYSTKTASRLRR